MPPVGQLCGPRVGLPEVGQGKRGDMTTGERSHDGKSSIASTPDIDTVVAWRGRKVLDAEGQAVGTFDEIYLDEDTDRPAWAAVRLGILGIRRRIVPLAGAEAQGDKVRMPFGKDRIRSAPKIDAEGWVSEHDREQIFDHYGLSGSPAPAVGASPDNPPSPAVTDAAGGELEPESVSAVDQQGVGEQEGADSGRPAEDRESPVDRPPGKARVRLKRYVVTETVAKRSEF